MLQTAVQMKDALNHLCIKNDTLKIYTLSSSDWFLLEQLIAFLKDFKSVSEKISGENYVKLPTAIISFNCLLDKIETKSFELDEKENRSQVDEKLILAFQKGRDKLIKHYHKCNWVYCVSLILDPRVKAAGLEATKWGREMVDQTLDKFKCLYQRYNNYYTTAD